MEIKRKSHKHLRSATNLFISGLLINNCIAINDPNENQNPALGVVKFSFSINLKLQPHQFSLTIIKFSITFPTPLKLNLQTENYFLQKY